MKTLCSNFIFLIFVSAAGPAVADDVLVTSFQEWAEREDMAPAALVALDRDGALLFVSAVEMDVDTPMAIASISKTIAGQCAVHAARMGVLSLDDDIGNDLGWSTPQGQVTYAELLTHSSGFGPDQTQGDFTGRLLQDEARIARLVASLAFRPLTDTNGDHSYNNENYLVLEAAMSAALGEDAFEWCTRQVPNIAAHQSLGLADALNALGFAGGMELSTSGLAKFFHALPQTHTDWPVVPMDASNSYGPGIIVQTIASGKNLFHVGGVCTIFGPNLGAFAAQLANGTSIAITYSGCASPQDLTFLNGFALELLKTP